MTPRPKPSRKAHASRAWSRKLFLPATRAFGDGVRGYLPQLHPATHQELLLGRNFLRAHDRKCAAAERIVGSPKPSAGHGFSVCNLPRGAADRFSAARAHGDAGQQLYLRSCWRHACSLESVWSLSSRSTSRSSQPLCSRSRQRGGSFRPTQTATSSPCCCCFCMFLSGFTAAKAEAVCVGDGSRAGDVRPPTVGSLFSRRRCGIDFSRSRHAEKRSDQVRGEICADGRIRHGRRLLCDVLFGDRQFVCSRIRYVDYLLFA